MVHKTLLIKKYDKVENKILQKKKKKRLGSGPGALPISYIIHNSWEWY